MFLIEDATWHLLSKALHRSNADICMKKGFLGFFERKWRNHLLCFKKNLMECYASLLASTSNSTLFLWLNNFAMSSVRFILLGNLASAEKLFQSVGPSPTPFFLWLGSWDLALNYWACLRSHTMFASAVAMCSRALLLPIWNWISRLVVGKERSCSSKKGKFWGFYGLKCFSAPEALYPEERYIQTEAFSLCI